MSMRLTGKKWGAARRKARRSLAQISDEEDAELTQAAAADSDNPIIDERMFAHMRPAVEGVPEIVPAPAISAPGVLTTSSFVVAACKKSPISAPAVNTPERPVRMRQRMAGLVCAESIASLIARYISCVRVFFFSGRRIVMVRVAPSSVTVMCSVMAFPAKRSANDSLPAQPRRSGRDLEVAPAALSAENYAGNVSEKTIAVAIMIVSVPLGPPTVFPCSPASY